MSLHCPIIPEYVLKVVARNSRETSNSCKPINYKTGRAFDEFQGQILEWSVSQSFQTTVTKCHSLGDLNKRCLFLTALEVHKPKQIWCLVSTLPSSQMGIFLLCPYLMEGTREPSAVSFIRVLIPFRRAPSSRPNHLQKALPPSTITQGITLQHMNLEVELGGDTNILQDLLTN